MAERYKVLRSGTLDKGISFYRFSQELPKIVTPDSPAIDVMTDLKRVTAVTIAPDVPIDAALQKMIHAEVRMLLVTDQKHEVVGLITARDLMGEKPVHFASQERLPRERILVEHIMTPQPDIQVLHMEDVLHSRVGDIIMTLREAGRQHALVVEPDGLDKSQVIRGIFSTTQIGRQLGMEIQPTGIVQNFAQLEAVLNH
ncbi:CBS domain-containing protein [Thermithiobacillus tepidarius DSM 3134]|uniref:CBS domain-containing protein n=1 Tax=Thermithiobacillus tepidarius TaxID=929 RepID=UPI0003FF58CD|nr:CBS domain-containing protein [Thermithiobacillus tepidarius]